MYEFNYMRAASIEDALEKHNAGADARYMAGGMTLLPVLKMRLDQPAEVVDLGYVDEMKGVEGDGDEVVVGAMTPHAVVARDATVNARIPALAKLAGSIGDPLVRNRGTIGGSLANNDPAADYPSAILGLGATIVTEQREIHADDFIVDMFETALKEGELIRKVHFPVPKRAGYCRFPNPASRYPLVGVFVAETGDGVRVGVTGAGPHAFRVAEMEAALSTDFSEQSVRDIQVPADGLQSDIHASPPYRAHLITVMARRAVAEAVNN